MKDDQDRPVEPTQRMVPTWFVEQGEVKVDDDATQILDFRAGPDKPADHISQRGRQEAKQPDDYRSRLDPLSRGITRLGSFELYKLLGEGGFSWVYLARQIFDEQIGSEQATEEGSEKRIQRDVAIKVLKKTGAAREFKAEVDTLATLGSHPHIIDIHDGRTTIGVDPDGYWYEYAWLAMPYAGGGTLQQWLRSYHKEGKTPPPAQLAEYLDQIASALDHAHGLGRIHRDIKPANILFDDYNRALLSDFGIAMTVSDQSMASSYGTAFTPSYMAPEQVPLSADEPIQIDGRTDIYSLGVVLFETLTGEVPYKADNVAGLQYQIVFEPAPSARVLNSGVPRRIDGVLQKTMAKDPDDRYQTAGDLARAFRAAVGFMRRFFIAAAALVALCVIASVLSVAVLRAATIQQTEQEIAEATQMALRTAAAGDQLNSQATQAAVEAAADTRVAEQHASRTAEASQATAIAEATAEAAENATREVAAVTATYVAQPTPPPGEYIIDIETQSEGIEDFSDDGELLRRAIPVLRIDKAEVLDDGSIRLYISQWVEYPFISERILAGYALEKQSDRNKTSMYLTDQQGRRYNYSDVGGDVGRDVTMEQDVVAEGWLHFPPPEPGGTIFTFHNADENYDIPNIDLSGE